MSSPGYSDEVAQEAHDLIEHAEEEAHLDEEGMPHPNSNMGQKMKKKSGLEGSSSSSSKQGMSGNMGKKMGESKDSMGKTQK
ncbi:hypothetical protein QBC39DRAFT_373252 [Podospora conica]|nr:hypothetical protein QBC39DRAFT_373252 [Schizothecium conicum]